MFGSVPAILFLVEVFGFTGSEQFLGCLLSEPWS